MKLLKKVQFNLKNIQFLEAIKVFLFWIFNYFPMVIDINENKMNIGAAAKQSPIYGRALSAN